MLLSGCAGYRWMGERGWERLERVRRLWVDGKRVSGREGMGAAFGHRALGVCAGSGRMGSRGDGDSWIRGWDQGMGAALSCVVHPADC